MALARCSGSPHRPRGDGPRAGPANEVATAPLALPDRPSIAVLPFANMSGDPERVWRIIRAATAGSYKSLKLSPSPLEACLWPGKERAPRKSSPLVQTSAAGAGQVHGDPDGDADCPPLHRSPRRLFSDKPSLPNPA